MANIAIVGAGLLGRFLALLLAPQHKITLYDKSRLQDEKATGRIAAAMVAPAAESVHAHKLVVQMGLQSCKLWQPLLTHLGLTTHFQQTGSLVLAHRQDLPELRQFQARVKPPELVQTLPGSKLNELEPELQSSFAGVLWLPVEGHIDNCLLYQEMDQRLSLSGICIRESVVARVNANQVTVEGEAAEYDWVVDSRGMGAKAHLEERQKTLRGVRGEVIRVKAPEVNISRPVRLMHPRYPLYLVPKSDSQYVIGATEIESECQKGLTVRSGLELLSAAYSLHKGFAEAEVLALNVGLRPTLSDNLPKVILASENCIQINGLYRHGYLLAPWILVRTLRVLQDAGLAVPDFNSSLNLPEIDNLDAQILEILCK